ncbi:MFS transporter [Flavihumibacter profundi]|uniref:MFS transporter n=1 Tax=Flavihumibacter profundi TaxID=2716883 RepID=UPI001CC82F14|nr:MFS transporter [Flavihumibacter profundi]MBZ5856782.1 MFS transporter [Flavihumibacter profundi]
MKEQLHLSEGELGLVLFAFPVGLLLTLPFTSMLLQKYSSKSIMFGGALAFNGVLCLPGTAAYIWQLVMVLLAFGITRNLLNLSMNAQAVETQHRYNRSIMNSFHGVWSLAGFAGASIGYLMVSKDVAVSYHLIGVSLLLFILTIIFIPLTNSVPPRKEERRSFFKLPEPALLNFSLICFASMACENTMYDWGSIYFRQEMHTSKGLATLAFVVYMIAMTTGRFLGDWMTNKLGILPLLTLSGTLIVTGFSIVLLTHMPYPGIAGYILIGLGVSCVVPLVFSMAGKTAGANTGAALASISTIGYVGFLFIPPFVGLVAEATSLRWSFGCIAMMGALIIWLTRIMQKTAETA